MKKITIHQNGRVYKVGLRAAYESIQSEAQLRMTVAKTIEGYRNQGMVEYADALARKDLMELLGIIGIVSN